MSYLRPLTPNHDLRPAFCSSCTARPNWTFFYRQFISALRDDFHCVALDFPGFGLSPSDARQPPTMMALSLLAERFVETLDLRDIILVVGDAGGPIGPGVAARHPDWFAGPVFAFIQEHSNFLMKYTAGTFRMSAPERAAFLGPYVGAAHRRSPGALFESGQAVPRFDWFRPRDKSSRVSGRRPRRCPRRSCRRSSGCCPDRAASNSCRRSYRASRRRSA
jgi:pimeloyl-ACP methyl ester carboxylesterase